MAAKLGDRRANRMRPEGYAVARMSQVRLVDVRDGKMHWNLCRVQCPRVFGPEGWRRKYLDRYRAIMDRKYGAGSTWIVEL